MILLDGDSLTLDELVAIADDGARGRARAGRRRARRRGARRRRSQGRRRRSRLRHQHRLRRAGRDADSARRARRAPAQSAAQPRGRRRRAAAGPRGARDDGAARQRARQGVLRHPPRHARAADRRCSTRASTRACRAAGRSARAATSRRSPISRSCWSAKARRPSATSRRALPARDALARAGLEPVTLEPKEGLALINGTQPSTAVAALALVGAERLARAADIAAALSIDALRGSLHPFDARIHAARPHPGQRASAANMLALLAGSAINQSHEHCGRVQDAYSLRCAAQVHGAARDALALRARHARRSRPTPRPTTRWCSPTTDDIVSGGNFHGAPVAIAADVRGDRARAARDDQRAAVGSARQSGAERPAAVPDARQRPALGLHDGAGHRRGAGVRDQDARASRERRHDPDLGEPRRPRQHEHGRGAQGRARVSSWRRASSRSRSCCACQAIDLLAPLDDVARARARARARAIDRADARRRPSAGARHRGDFEIDRRRLARNVRAT